MKIILVQPNSVEETQKDFVSLQFPINLGYLAAALREAGHEVILVDLNVMPKNELSKSIKKHHPQAIGVTAFTANIFNATNIIKDIKRINPKIVTILGGVHASALPVETITSIKELDYLVYGEGEETAKELIHCIENDLSVKDVKGIVYRKNRKIIKNPRRELIKDINTIPFPARDLVPQELYKKSHVSRGFSRSELNIIEIITSRGCPNRCIFCAGHINYGFSLRFRTYENVVAEITECIEKYGTNHISIEDDTFTINKDLVIKLCAFLKKNNITWNCNTRVNTVNYKLLKIMAQSGCRKVAFGVESGNPEILKKTKKGITLEQTINAVRAAKKAGIRYVECDFMIGSHIDETKSDVEDTVKLINKLMPDFLMVSVMCPYPGTEIYDMMVAKKYLKKNIPWSKFSFFGNLERYDRITYMDSKEMSDLQKSILKKYYGSPRYVFSQVKQIRSLKEIRYFFRLGLSFFREFLFKRS